MSNPSLNHIGIAVPSIDELRPLYETLGLKLTTRESVPSEGVNVAFLPLENGGKLELLEAVSSESPIKRFLEKRGPGIHHFCLNVADLNKTLARLKAKGVVLIDDEPRIGAKGAKVAFIHPRSTGGVLIELCQCEKAEAEQ